MENKESFDKDDITRSLLNKAGLEEPSWDFTSRIMAKLHTATTPEVFIYKPAISRNAWILISLMAAIFFLYLFFLSPPSSNESVTVPNYAVPISSFISWFSSGFSKNIPAFPAMPGMIGVIAAGWILFGFDKFIGRKREAH